MPRAWVTSDAYSAVVAVLVETRKATGLSQRDLSDRLGKPRSYISKIETKERRVDVLEFIELAEALDIQPDDLFGRVTAALRK